MSAADSNVLNWLSWLYTFGAWCVVLGVAMESAEIFARRSAKRKQSRFIGPLQNSPPEPQTPHWAHTIGDIGFLILVSALVIEQVCHQRMEVITDRERNRLTAQLDLTKQQASDAIKLAADSNVRASKFDFARAEIEKYSEELKSNNLVLQLQLQPRRITPTQVTNFIFLTERITKNIPIKVCMGQEEGDTGNYAYQIRCLLTAARFKPDVKSGDVLDITRDPTRIVVTPIGDDDEKPALVNIICTTTNGFAYFPAIEIETGTNGLWRPIVTENDPEKVYWAIFKCFNKIGITTVPLKESSWVKPGEFEFFIPTKSN